MVSVWLLEQHKKQASAAKRKAKAEATANAEHVEPLSHLLSQKKHLLLQLEVLQHKHPTNVHAAAAAAAG